MLRLQIILGPPLLVATFLKYHAVENIKILDAQSKKRVLIKLFIVVNFSLLNKNIFYIIEEIEITRRSVRIENIR